ncbi:Lrp/AsnC family transcriptional regulator [Candidatus Bathyarchaeota archaeon]|nr:Lrp/AsnC family transcriptional regulator [Candidatus Bathyarchaeota archaeon]RJS74669.1 MAG: Lrp/AsnC family transcriptional regulator [Candidatus Bathyarchaeota archaeon]
MHANIDEKDLRILSLLLENSSVTLVDIGRKLNMHPNVVAYRINKLEEMGVIKGYTVVLDLEKLGLTEYMCVGVNFPDHRFRNEFLKRIRDIPQVTMVISSLGKPEGILFVVGRNKEEIDNILSKLKDMSVEIEFATPIIKSIQNGLIPRILEAPMSERRTKKSHRRASIR